MIHSHCCWCHLRSVASVSRYTPWTKIWVTYHWMYTWYIYRLQAVNRTPFHELQLISWVIHKWQLILLSFESSDDTNKPWIEAKAQSEMNCSGWSDNFRSIARLEYGRMMMSLQQQEQNQTSLPRMNNLRIPWQLIRGVRAIHTN